MDSKGNLYRQEGERLMPKGSQELTEHEYNVLAVTAKEDRPVTLAWLRYCDRTPKLKTIEKLKAKIAFYAAWSACLKHINEE